MRGAPITVISWPGAITAGSSPIRTSMFAGAPSVKLIVSFVPSGFVCVSVIAMCGLRNFSVSTTPLNSMFCVMSQTANEWCAAAGNASAASAAPSRATIVLFI